MNDDRRFEKYAYEIDTVQYTGKLPEGIAAEDKDGKKLVYKTINRNGENVFRQGYICLSLKSEKEAYISLERDFVEVHTKDGQCLFSVCKKEWNEELAHVYYNEESYENEKHHPVVDIYCKKWKCNYFDLTHEARKNIEMNFNSGKIGKMLEMPPIELNKKYSEK